ncbi:uncharacterized protein LOC128216505 [Mya arenaria]|uniref:uncharacterized protein LOC128216505 n=1 Tax=Mya arenaria TaxID=6604 RepID=UPI0022DEC550|nr:uncharacterized protein LOC128216505 [Mya arenaria]
MSTNASGIASTTSSPTQTTLSILFTQSGRNTSVVDSKSTVQEITATSPHTTYSGNIIENIIFTTKVRKPLTTQSATQSSQPFVIYDGPYKLTEAIVVEPGKSCFVHNLTEEERQMITSGSKQSFENALLYSKLDPHSGWNVTGQIGHMSTEVQTFCTGPVYVLW